MIDFVRQRRFVLSAVGRANLDLYPPRGAFLEQARSYQAFVGGSAANVAVGLARRAHAAALISCVADDAHGAFICNYLHSMGVNVEQIQRDKQACTSSLAFAERRADAQTLMYRQQAADLQLQFSELDKNYVGQSSMLFVTGTALSSEPSRSTVWQILEVGQKEQVKLIIDLDYRPYGWESKQEVARQLGSVARQCHIILGTEEEFKVAQLDPFKDICQQNFPYCQLVVIKRGQKGSTALLFHNGKLLQQIQSAIYPVQPVKPWGAGDAFAASLLASLYEERELKEALKHATAAASLNICGDSCTEAMPTLHEIRDFIKKNIEQCTQ